MSRDLLDDLSARLFAAARQERPPAGAERRALEAARHAAAAPPARGGRSKVFLLAAALSGFALVLLALSRRERPDVSIAAERASSASRAPRPTMTTGLERPTTTPLSATSPAESASVSAKGPPSAGVAVRSLPTTLADELDALKIAQQALNASDARAALKALDRYDQVLKGQKLRAEATLLRIEALSLSGRREAAAELARRFTEQNPTSPLVDRARSFIKPGLGGSEHE